MMSPMACFLKFIMGIESLASPKVFLWTNLTVNRGYHSIVVLNDFIKETRSFWHCKFI